MIDGYEFKMTFFDICGDEATVSVVKTGGGTIGKRYEGSWEVRVNDGPYGPSDVMSLHPGTPRTHFDVAVESYEFYLQDNEGAR